MLYPTTSGRVAGSPRHSHCVRCLLLYAGSRKDDRRRIAGIAVYRHASRYRTRTGRREGNDDCCRLVRRQRRAVRARGAEARSGGGGAGDHDICVSGVCECHIQRGAAAVIHAVEIEARRIGASGAESMPGSFRSTRSRSASSEHCSPLEPFPSRFRSLSVQTLH